MHFLYSLRITIIHKLNLLKELHEICKGVLYVREDKLRWWSTYRHAVGEVLLLAIHEHIAFQRCEGRQPSRQGVQQGGLPGARGAHDGQQPSRLGIARHTMQHHLVLAFSIGERHPHVRPRQAGKTQVILVTTTTTIAIRCGSSLQLVQYWAWIQANRGRPRQRRVWLPGIQQLPGSSTNPSRQTGWAVVSRTTCHGGRDRHRPRRPKFQSPTRSDAATKFYHTCRSIMICISLPSLIRSNISNTLR